MLWLFLACSSETEKTSESVDELTGLQEEKVVIEHPLITVTSPSRGQFIMGSEIPVQGTVQEGSASITSLTLDKEAIAFDGGTFDVIQSGRPGVNFLNFRLEAEDRGRAVESIGVYQGTYLEPDESVQNGLMFQIGQELLDDGDPDLDDLASIGEQIINNLDLTTLLGGQTYPVSDHELTINDVSHGGFDIGITCGETLTVTASVTDVYLDAYIDALTGFDGIMTIDQVDLELELNFEVRNGRVEVIVVDDYITFTNLQTDDWLPFGLGWLEPLIVGAVQDEIESVIGEQVVDLVETLVADYLNAFILDTEIFAGVSIVATIAELEVTDDGLQMLVDASFQGALNKSIPNGAGSARIAGSAPSWPLSTQEPFALAVSGDLINQLIFAIWGTGYFEGIEIDGVLIQGLSGGAIPAPIGPVEHLEIDFGLPPSIYPAQLGDMTASLAIGEWKMHFFREDGEEIDFRINLESGLDLFVEDGKVKIDIDDRPAEIELGISTLSGPEYLDKGDLSALGRLMIPSLLGSVTAFLPSIDLPPIPLGTLAENLEGTELTIQDADVSMTYTSWLLIEANIE